MSDDGQRIAVITGAARRRHGSTEAKLRIIEESFEPDETVSPVAGRCGVGPNLLYRWRRLLREGGRSPWIRRTRLRMFTGAPVRRACARSGAAAWPQNYRDEIDPMPPLSQRDGLDQP